MPRMKLLTSLALALALLMACSSAPATETNTADTAAPATPNPADEEATLTTLSAINKAQADFFIRSRRYALTYDELIEALFLQAEPSADTLGYDVRLRPAADAGRYTVIATPVSGSPTTRHFFTDQTGEIRAEEGKDATAASPVVQGTAP